MLLSAAGTGDAERKKKSGRDTREEERGGGGTLPRGVQVERITPNKLVSRFVSVVFNTDKEIERIL